MNKQEAEQRAHQKVKQKVEFRIHLLTYIAVNTLLAIINLTLTPVYLWFIWPLLGWGIGIISHGINVRYSNDSSIKQRMIEKEMRKTGLMILMMFLSVSMYAQDDQSKTSYSGYGGPLVYATQLNNQIGICIGGKGGTVINEILGFGGLGFGTVTPIQFTGLDLADDENASLEMTYGAGGLFFEYVFNYGDRIEFSVPLNLMAGGIHVYERGTETEIESTALFILEPGINIDLNVSQYYTQSFFVSYRQALGSSLTNLSDKNISGLNIGLIFKFGK